MNRQGIVAIVSHDAGGAEILASYVSQHKFGYRFVLQGPAINVFKRRHGTVEACSLEEALTVSDAILCGTSWQSDLEWNAIEQAQKAGKRAVAFLDHWINFQERFLRHGVQHLPDELWVGDAETEKLAREQFPNVMICLVANPYFIDIRRQLAEISSQRKPAAGAGKTVLYVSENISEHARVVHGDERYLGYTEFDAIEYFLKHISALNELIDHVVIRPHPSDKIGKYDYLVKKHPGIVRLSAGEPLLNEVVNSDIVVGSQSTAMVVGLLARKLVISCIPPGSPKCNLPQQEILNFSDMVHGSTNSLRQAIK